MTWKDATRLSCAWPCSLTVNVKERMSMMKRNKARCQTTPEVYQASERPANVLQSHFLSAFMCGCERIIRTHLWALVCSCS
mmetsp:Transcript_43880/g.105081  ORF Transcript_43880/g.105081 Transcript_43880/m.105081 type:complete len:81 (+) Transcript_43880:438-680(+)